MRCLLLIETKSQQPSPPHCSLGQTRGSAVLPGAILFSPLSTEFCVLLRFVVSMCVAEKRTDSAFLSVSYQDHVTVMVASGDAQFDENLFISTILALHEAFQEEEEKSESALSHEDNKRLLLATIV